MSNLKPGEVMIHIQASGKCPCGKLINAGYIEGGIPAVDHQLPTCKDFDRIDSPIDYLEWVNKSMRAN